MTLTRIGNQLLRLFSCSNVFAAQNTKTISHVLLVIQREDLHLVLVGLGVVLGDQDDLSVVFVAPPVGLTLVEDLVVVNLLNERRIVVESSIHSVQIVV